MILNSAPQNEAVISNVAEIGEFRIRNSAKAFSILSAGLYANKIRAIVRELSCNALDSHVAAGKADTPFELHLPTSWEPWFSIRDFGIGLNHSQLVNIYTTYFESTKTGSNDYIGALGLGSKTPFSYTDNFTVTAIKDGICGIYSAFINDVGVPSVALMSTHESTDPTGVEIKFSIEDKNDFYKFIQESADILKYFKVRPIQTGATLSIHTVKYVTKDIIPGVHTVEYQRSSVAIMGNIAYPIGIPSTDTKLGDLSSLLECGLEMNFGIGELDFQASREGLSYIPQTVDNIVKKLTELNDKITLQIATETDVIENMWEKRILST